MMIILMTFRLIKQDNLTSLSDKCWQNYTTIKSNFGPSKNDHFKDVSQNFMSTFQIIVCQLNYLILQWHVVLLNFQTCEKLTTVDKKL